MPSTILFDDVKGIPPMEGGNLKWEGADGPLMCQLALEIFQTIPKGGDISTADAIIISVDTAAQLMKTVALYMNKENEETYAAVEEHVKKHTRIVRLVNGQPIN